jgi:hypothetical protein
MPSEVSMPHRTLAAAHAVLLSVSLLSGCAYDAASVLEGAAPDAGVPPLVVVGPDAGLELPPIHGAGIEALPGTWYTCHGALTFRADGTYVQRESRSGCAVEGTWADRGDGSFDMVASHGDCGQLPSPRSRIRYEFTTTGLVLVHPTFGGGFARYLSESQPRAEWAIEATPGEGGFGGGGGPGRSILSIVGEPGRGGFGCYWSAEGECGGAFSCGGSVHYWDVRDGVLRAGLNCSGDCSCGSTLQGSYTSDRIEGTFRAHNCNRAWEGVFSAVRKP